LLPNLYGVHEPFSGKFLSRSVDEAIKEKASFQDMIAVNEDIEDQMHRRANQVPHQERMWPEKRNTGEHSHQFDGM